MNSFLVHTSTNEKEALDIQVARMIFATNSVFNLVEHKEFIPLCNLLRPEYKPPSRLDVGNRLLDQVHEDVFATSRELVEGRTISMELDGWSNIANEPIICASITTATGDTFLTETIDTQDEKHTANNLEKIALKAIEKAKDSLGCNVKSFVTDNAATMKKMRSLLEEDLPIITYPCSSHVADRLAKDIKIDGAIDDIITVAKHIRNTHQPGAWYKAAGGKKLPLPSEVRWNTVHDTLEGYITNYHALQYIAKTYKADMKPDIADKINDIQIKRTAEDYLARMKPIAVALDKLQSDTCHITDAVVIWKELEQELEHMPIKVIKAVQSRMNTALTPAHYLANILDPRHHGQSLTPRRLIRL